MSKPFSSAEQRHHIARLLAISTASWSIDAARAKARPVVAASLFELKFTPRPSNPLGAALNAS
jgi:hypothetical protein